MTELIYLGPNSSIYLGEGKKREAKPLVTGVSYKDLPQDEQTVKTLIARGLLVEAATAPEITNK